MHEHFLDLHNVTNGCVSKFPRDVTLQSADEEHSVRCCNEVGDTCTSPEPCQLASTYREAILTCYDLGLRLCSRNEMVSNMCCGTGCQINQKTTWLADDTSHEGKQ